MVLNFNLLAIFMRIIVWWKLFFFHHLKRKLTSEMGVEPLYNYKLITLPIPFTLRTLLSAYTATLLTLRKLLSLLTLLTLLTQLRSKRAMIPDT